jgi:hypothetical protein
LQQRLGDRAASKGQHVPRRPEKRHTTHYDRNWLHGPPRLAYQSKHNDRNRTAILRMNPMKFIIKKYRLWLWDRKNLGTLELASRRQVCYLANGMKSARLEFIINKLRAERLALTN